MGFEWFLEFARGKFRGFGAGVLGPLIFGLFDFELPVFG